MSNIKLETDSAAINQAIVSLINEHARSTRKKQRQNAIKLLGLFLMGGLMVLYGFWVWRQAQGHTSMPTHPHAAVIKIEGTIGGNATSQKPENINKLLSRAFSNSSTKAVVLHISSGGGRPETAERVGRYARSLADRHQKPLIAHIDGMGASAAYLLAIHADEVYISSYSLTGSVGAVMLGLNWNRLAEKVGVEQVAIASSELKTVLSPWSETPDPNARFLQALVDSAATLFADHVVERRGQALKIDRDELQRALVYTADQAHEAGLVDGIMTLDELLVVHAGMPGYHMEHRRNLYEQLLVTTWTTIEPLAAGLFTEARR